MDRHFVRNSARALSICASPKESPYPSLVFWTALGPEPVTTCLWLQRYALAARQLQTFMCPLIADEKSFALKLFMTTTGSTSPESTALKTAGNSAQFQRAYDNFCETLPSPWKKRIPKRPLRFRYFWTRALDALAAQRSRLYRIAVRTKLESDWEAYRTLDRQMKRQARRNKRSSFRCFTHEVSEMPSPEVTEVISRIRIDKQRTNTRNNTLGCQLDPSEFTRHIATTSSTTIPAETPLLPFPFKPQMRGAIN